MPGKKSKPKVKKPPKSEKKGTRETVADRAARLI